MHHPISTILLLALLFVFSCSQPQKTATETITNKEVKTETKAITESVLNIPVYDFKQFEPLLQLNNDTTYIVNFWATWCKPCVAELPYFEEIHEQYKDQKVKVLLVSLDFSTQIKKKLIPFIQQRNLKPEVVVLDDPDSNSWINKVSNKWSGAIPATVIFKGEKRGFFEQSFESAEEIWERVEEVLKG